jgi:hypothetical protein
VTLLISGGFDINTFTDDLHVWHQSVDQVCLFSAVPRVMCSRCFSLVAVGVFILYFAAPDSLSIIALVYILTRRELQRPLLPVTTC